MSLNRVILTGRLTRDPEIRATQSGSHVAKLTVAISNFYKGEEKTSFIDCVGFGKTAELFRDYFKKGSIIGIDGTLHQENWETKEGEKRSKLVVYCDRIDFVGGGKKKDENNLPKKESENDQEYQDDGLPF